MRCGATEGGRVVRGTLGALKREPIPFSHLASLCPCSALCAGGLGGGQSRQGWGIRASLGQQSDESSSRVGLPFPWLLGRAPRTPRLAARLKEKEELEAPTRPYVLAVSLPLTTPARSLDLTGPLLLGGVPDLPESFPVRTRHFVGCMRDLQVDSRHVDMADFIANNGTMPGMGAGVRLNAERRDVPGVGAPGNGGSEPPLATATGFLLGASARAPISPF